jgi:hypothetical protein
VETREDRRDKEMKEGMATGGIWVWYG